MAYYSKTIQEEELKNKVREDWFAGYDNTEIPGKVDFCVGHNSTTYLWAEAKRGVKRDIYEQFVQLILTIQCCIKHAHVALGTLIAQARKHTLPFCFES